MKLYLDDERKEPEGWIRCRTAREAIVFLELDWDNVEEISLDHDLGSEALNGNGYDVLCWMENHAERSGATHLPTIRIHTANPAARGKMELARDSVRQLVNANRRGNSRKASPHGKACSKGG